MKETINKIVDIIKKGWKASFGEDSVEKTSDYADVILFNGDFKVLLLKRNDGSWWLPGGSVDEPDVSPRSAAIRELLEEANVSLDGVYEIDVRRTKEDSGDIHTFGAFSNEDTIVIDSGEHKDYKWFSIPELLVLEEVLYKQNDLLSSLCVLGRSKIISELMKEAFDTGMISENTFLQSMQSIYA